MLMERVTVSSANIGHYCTAQASATQRAGYAQARVEAVVTGDVDPYE